MVKTVYLIRHGETDFNTDPVPRVRGRIDVPLNAAGVRHAEQAGLALKDINLEIIYYSVINRAKTTAQLVHKQQKDCELIEEPLAIDISWGDWEGKTYLEAFGDENGGDYIKNPQKLNISNGESFQLVLDRIRKLLLRIMQSKYETVCIVSHGAILNLLGCFVTDAPLNKFWNFYMSGCGISKLLIYDIDDIRIGYWNRQEFLH